MRTSSTETSRAHGGRIAPARYNGRMMHEAFELRGSYQYADVAALENALSAARTRIEDDELGEIEPDWIQSFVRRGTRLSVRVELPAAADRYLAAEVLQTLAETAVDGVIEISRGGRCVDWFPSQPAD
jgi:hypothetical protein